MNKIMIADVCFLGPEERIINATKINIDKTLKIEFDISEIETVKGIMKIIMNNIYCTIDEIIKIKVNENISEKDEKKNNWKYKKRKFKRKQNRNILRWRMFKILQRMHILQSNRGLSRRLFLGPRTWKMVKMSTLIDSKIKKI